MGNAAWVLLVLGILALWAYTAYRMRRSLEQYREENRRLREASGGLESKRADAGRLDQFLSGVNEAILRLDADGRVLAANARARELFGIADDARLPMAMPAFYRDPDWNASLIEALKRRESSSLGSMRIASRVLAPRLTRIGREQALLLCMDITEQDRLERQRRTFLSNLMHDLKTPLTSLLGYARSLGTFGSDPAFVEEASRIIADEARHVNRLLDSMLTLDQIEFSRRDPDARCDAGAIAKDVLEMLQPQLQARGSHARLEIAEGLPQLAMASADCERVMTNLLENAIRYGAAGGHIDVRLGFASSEMIIAVEDDGPGVPEKEIPRLTERFYRVDKARSRREGGHGLGLAIVQELVSMHGGRLHIANVEPHGLKVELHLPIAEEYPGHAGEADEAASKQVS